LNQKTKETKSSRCCLGGFRFRYTWSTTCTNTEILRWLNTV